MKTIRQWLALSAVAAASTLLAATERHEIVLFDHEFKHTGSRQLWEDWNFDTRKLFKPDVPKDWLAKEHPILDRGIYVCRVEVTRMERAWTVPAHVQFGWWNFPRETDPSIRHIAAPPVLLTQLQPPVEGKPWVYEYVGTIWSLDVSNMYYGMGPKAGQPGKVTDWDWRHAYTADTAYTLFNPRDNRFDADGDGKITEQEYPDIVFRMSVTVYLPGSPRYQELSSKLSPFVGWRGKTPATTATR
jgi:hypothetical protein